MMIIWDKCGHGCCGRKNCDENVNDHVDHKMRRQKQVLLEAISEYMTADYNQLFWMADRGL